MCTGNCVQGRFCDCDQGFTDSELGVEPPPSGFRWDMLAVYGGSALAVVALALLMVRA